MPLLYPDGNIKYEGDLRNGRPHGDGVMYYENGNKRWEGVFEDGVFVNGIIYYADGKVWYEGTCKNDVIVGEEGKKYFYEEHKTAADEMLNRLNRNR